MIYPWKLNFWQSGEWQVCNERLKDMENAGIQYNPTRKELFRALRLTQPGEVKVCIVGQDPYPDSEFATGLAFSIPELEGKREVYPPTLRAVFNEYCSDLGYSFPSTGNLDGWAAQGVLLWNAIPSCRSGQSLSHDWPEYTLLTREIVQLLARRGIVFALLGAVARRHLGDIDLSNNEVILTSHPSPRGSRFSKTPFEGSRLFSTINDKLNSQGLDPINWRLDDVRDQQDTGAKAVLPKSGRVWNSNRNLSWEQGKNTRGVRDHGRLVVHE